MRKIGLDELKLLLRQFDKVKFSFKKKSGERRVAIATLKHEAIEATGYVFPELKPEDENKPKRKAPANVLSFFDLQEGGWRSCSTTENEEFNFYNSVDEELVEEDKPKKIASKFYDEDGETDESLKGDLYEGIVKFQFMKVSGEKRTAIGTTNKELLKHIGITPDESIYSDLSCIHFFDLKKKEWRAAKLGSILTVEYKMFSIKKDNFMEFMNTILPNLEEK